MRFAIWAAVSTREQASEDKFSLEVQQKRAQAEGLRRGWVQAAGPYIVPGHSREIYIDLADAERDIPALRQMLSDARANLFDVLIMTELDRLRSLQMQVFRYLARCRVQILALNAPIEPVRPDEYNQHRADAVLMLITISQASSSLEISRLRRKYDDGMPKRVTELGLPPIGIPYGYRKPLTLEPDVQAIRKAVPEQDPALVPHLLAMRDALLSGLSTHQIAADLNQKGIPAPRGGLWSAASVRGVLRNPFYAGRVSWGFSESAIDPATNKRKRTRTAIPREQAQGRHLPLWDDATHEAILAELHRRQRSYLGRRNNQLTGLLRCGVCGAPLWRQGNGPRDTDRLIWRCSRTGSAVGHVNIPHADLLPAIATALDERLRKELDSPAPPAKRKAPADPTADLTRQLERLETAYLAGGFDLDRYRLRKTDLDRKLAAARDAIRQSEQLQRDRAAWQASAAALSSLTDLRAWVLTADPQAVNHALRLLLDHITVSEGGIEIAFK